VSLLPPRLGRAATTENYVFIDDNNNAHTQREPSTVSECFLLTYTFLLGLIALVLGVVGGATNQWVSVRYVDAGPDGRQARASSC